MAEREQPGEAEQQVEGAREDREQSAFIMKTG
jgi:hypothetical protein